MDTFICIDCSLKFKIFYDEEDKIEVEDLKCPRCSGPISELIEYDSYEGEDNDDPY